MENLTPKTTALLFALCGIAFAVPCVAFAYYTFRLVVLAVTTFEWSIYRSSETVLLMLSFPLGTVLLGTISWLFFRSARRQIL